MKVCTKIISKALQQIHGGIWNRNESAGRNSEHILIREIMKTDVHISSDIISL